MQKTGSTPWSRTQSQRQCFCPATDVVVPELVGGGSVGSSNLITKVYILTLADLVHQMSGEWQGLLTMVSVGPVNVHGGADVCGGTGDCHCAGGGGG